MSSEAGPKFSLFGVRGDALDADAVVPHGECQPVGMWGPASKAAHAMRSFGLVSRRK